jgi:tetratricopeptide (TPR) repeat protein
VRDAKPDAEARQPAVAAPREPTMRAAHKKRSSPTRRVRDHAERRRAAVHFARGFVLEASDDGAARDAYAAALALHKGHLEASINLGRLLHLSGELEAAEAIYREAEYSSGLLSFNLALLLEDLRRDQAAIRAYREALALEPALHEAHFHLGMMYERLQMPREALKHLLAYRRQSQK